MMKPIIIIVSNADDNEVNHKFDDDDNDKEARTIVNALTKDVYCHCKLNIRSHGDFPVFTPKVHNLQKTKAFIRYIRVL